MMRIRENHPCGTPVRARDSPRRPLVQRGRDPTRRSEVVRRPGAASRSSSGRRPRRAPPRRTRRRTRTRPSRARGDPPPSTPARALRLRLASRRRRFAARTSPSLAETNGMGAPRYEETRVMGASVRASSGSSFTHASPSSSFAAYRGLWRVTGASRVAAPGSPIARASPSTSSAASGAGRASRVAAPGHVDSLARFARRRRRSSSNAASSSSSSGTPPGAVLLVAVVVAVVVHRSTVIDPWSSRLRASSSRSRAVSRVRHRPRAPWPSSHA